ncbi:restriction endonuclease subunit S [Xanthomonas sp. LMG 12461]|uniref:restriction endonuclease subunit S n=1 Tax=Xanthomonas sp. LMG 12461 TaxID=2014543 RepID=UPI0012656354|nr:restriction endonuclease subunit S [Xanthomonas sp. LMG 12461]KAB7767768.1 hypothetical protein CEK68_07265 [Xanthomonas sp. LMG 12461]
MSEWLCVPLGELLCRSDEPAALVPNAEYHEVTIRLWGKGVVSRGLVRGSDVTTPRRLVRAGQLILSKIDARNGALGIVPPELDGAVVSNDFPSYSIVNPERCLPEFLGILVKSRSFVELCKASSEGTTNRVRLKEDRFLRKGIALPPLPEQRAIVSRLDTLADKTRQLTAHLDAAEADADRLLAQQFRAAIANAPRRAMAEVAPLKKRQVVLETSKRYREVGARSFGKGLFFKPDFDAAEVTWEKPVWIKAGDVVFSNIKAWEGAIALAGDEHDEVIASHRYITCVANPEQLLSSFLLYYLLSPEGLEKIGEASAGTADRNRTLSLKKLAKIEMPVPSLSTQQAFVDLQAIVSAIKARHAAIREANAVLLPATLERLFPAEDRSP